jgi:hypothetical protein
MMPINTSVAIPVKRFSLERLATLQILAKSPLLGRRLGSCPQEANPLPQMVPLLRLAPEPDRRELKSAHHSENSVGFQERQDGPIKGMGF